MNLATRVLERNARRIPNRIAIIDGQSDKTTTYKELDQEVNRTADALISLGVQRGDRVGIYLRNVPEFIVVFLANCKIGAISVPCNIMLRKIELEYTLNNAQVKVVFGMSDEVVENLLPIVNSIPSLEKIVTVRGNASSSIAIEFEQLISDRNREFQAVELDETDPISLLYTSGATGRPKGALASHGNWFSQTKASAERIVPMNEGSVVLTGGAFFHVYLVIAVLPTLYTGATVVTLTRFYPEEALELIAKHRITHFMGTPTMWVYMIEKYLQNTDNYDMSSLRLGQSAGAPLAADLGERIETVFKLGLVECYGATECSSTVSHTKFGRYIPGSPGWPQPGWEVKIVGKIGKELPPGQVGELWCKGPGVIGKYWKDPLATKKSFEDGWWKSGDLAYIEASGPAAGTVHIVDRKDDMIVCGGYNIYPSEVQSYLAGHPKILQAIVVGIPDEVKVEIPKAFIVLKPGQQATEQEIITWAKTIMAAYKAPRKVEFVSMDDLPQTATGKILKRELRSLETKKNSH